MITINTKDNKIGYSQSIKPNKVHYTLGHLNNEFKNKLKNVYSNAEIQQLRFMVCENVLQLTKVQQIADQNYEVSDEKFKQMLELIDRLANCEPIQYILGETEFYELKFDVNNAVLIPRPETEELVHWILNDNKKPNLRVLDMGTGSGCIAISLAKFLNNAAVFGFDISALALETATMNVRKNKVLVSFIEGNILDAVGADIPGSLDIIVSNPPYVRESEKQLMHNNVLKFEPELALFVSNLNPLIFYDRIAKLGTTNLKKGGFIYFEINEAFGPEVKLMLESYDYSHIEIRNDLNGKTRMVKGTY